MKRVHDIAQLRVGQHVRFQRLGAAKGQDGSTVTGEVVGHRENGDTIIRRYDGTETPFSHARGDRLSKLTAKQIVAPVLGDDGWAPPRVVDLDFHAARLKRAHLHVRIAACLAGFGFALSVGLVAAIVLGVI